MVFNNASSINQSILHQEAADINEPNVDIFTYRERANSEDN